MMSSRFKQHSVLPGFGLTLGYSLLYLSLIVLIPLSALFLKTATTSWAHIWETISDPRAVASYRLTLYTSIAAALINVVFGLLVAWVLVRYRFPGKALLNAIVDMPFAIPTLVTGVTLVVLYGPQQAIGGWFERTLGLRIIFAPPGIGSIAIVGTPFFSARTVPWSLVVSTTSIRAIRDSTSAEVRNPVAFISRRVSICTTAIGRERVRRQMASFAA